MKPALTVVIPTYNRANRLRKALESLINQSLDKELFEITIVDDGSDDGTGQMVADLSKEVNHHIRYYWQENKFAGSARNLGILRAEAGIVLLMDDDIIPNKDHLKQHLELHLKYTEPEVAVRGRITAGSEGVDLLRPDELDNSPIGRAPDGEPIISAMNFVSADVSFKRELVIKAGSFTPGLPVAEDTDLALRLAGLGLKLVYCPEAVAIHTEPLDTLQKVVNNARTYGQAFAQWYGRIPLYHKEVWRLGGRFDGGWYHFSRHPWGYLKDGVRRWSINKYTIKPILEVATKITVTNPPNKILVRCCKEIWAYYYRHEFQEQRRQVDKQNK